MRTYIDPISGKTKSLAHNQKQIGKRKREKLMKITEASSRRWFVPVYWSDAVFDWSRQEAIPAEGAYITRIYRPMRSRYYKTRAHRKARRREVYDTTYHKATEFWWELF